MKKKVVGIYPGSFDPVTYGHLDLIKRSLSFCDSLIVAVAADSPKKTIFTVEERLNFLRIASQDIRRLKIETFKGLLVNYVKKKGTSVVIRGLRALSDFEYELQMALTNRKLAPTVETVFLMPKEEYFAFSSRLIKELAYLGADLKQFVPPLVAKALIKKIKNSK